jgi:hypothetical protein
MHRLPWVIEFSSGDVAFMITPSSTCNRSVQPTPQYGQIVSVAVMRDSSHVPSARFSYSVVAINAPVGHTAMQLPQYTHADSGSGTANSVDLRGLGYGGGERGIRRRMMAGHGRIARSRRRRRSRRSKPFGLRLVFVDPLGDLWRRREIDRGREHLENELAAVLDARRLRVHDHSLFDRARARWNEDACAVHLDDADAARIHRM